MHAGRAGISPIRPIPALFYSIGSSFGTYALCRKLRPALSPFHGTPAVSFIRPPPSGNHGEEQYDEQGEAVEHEAAHLGDRQCFGVFISCREGGADEYEDAQERDGKDDRIGETVQEVGTAVRMQADTFPNLILDLSEGRHGGARHAAEEHRGDRDAEHHGKLSAAGASAEPASKNHVCNLFQRPGRRKYAHDAVHGYYEGYGGNHTIDAIREESGGSTVFDRKDAVRGEKTESQPDYRSKDQPHCNCLQETQLRMQ